MPLFFSLTGHFFAHNVIMSQWATKVYTIDMIVCSFETQQLLATTIHVVLVNACHGRHCRTSNGTAELLVIAWLV